MKEKIKQTLKFVNRVKSFCLGREHIYIKLGFFAFVLIFGAVLSIQIVSAQGVLSDIGSYFLEAVTKIFLVLAQLFMALTIFALRYFVELAAYNNHTLADTVVLGWTMVRDVSNMFFVVVLLAIAFGTILGLDQYEWKKLTVKLVFAAIFINFSKLIAGIIIDAAHVFTITFLNAVVATAGGNVIQMFQLDKILSFAADKVNNPTGGDITLPILGGAIAAFIFSFVALLSVGAYSALMLSRVLILWVLIILSPLAYILSILPNTQKWASEYWAEFTKYVLAAPIMVFFLWLAFATMGNGNINQQEIGKYAAQQNPNAALTNSTAGSREKEISASLSEVTEWESMASFFVAVAFLFVGLMQVGKLGVIGGGLVAQATGIGTRFAAVVTGAAAAGYLGGKALEGAKGAGRIAISPVTRTARVAKARVGIGIKKLQTAQAQYAKALEKKGFLGRRLAGIVEIGSGRKEKKVKDWEAAAENWAGIRDAFLGTSSLEGGKAKLVSNVYLKRAEAMKNAKMEQKSIEQELKLLKEEGDSSWRGNLDWKKYAGFSEITKSISDADVAAEDLKKQSRYKNAEIKAKSFMDVGNLPRAEQEIASALAATLKESSEGFTNMSWHQKTETAGFQGLNVQKAKEGYEKAVAQKLEPDKIAAAKRKYQEQLQRSIALQTSLFNDSHAAGETGLQNALKSVGWTEEINDSNKVRAFLSATLGRNIQAGADEAETAKRIEAAIQEVEQGYANKNQAHQALRILDDSFKKTASQGGINMSGLVGHTTDPQTGRVSYKLNVTQDVKGSGAFFAKRQDLRKLDGVTGFADTNLEGEVTGFSSERAEQFGVMLNGATNLTVSQMLPAFTDSINNAVIVDRGDDAEKHKKQIAEYKEVYRRVADNVADRAAFEAFVNRTKKLFDRLGMSVDEAIAGTKISKASNTSGAGSQPEQYPPPEGFETGRYS